MISESLSSIEFEPKDLEFVANEELITVLVTTARDLAVSEYESVSVILTGEEKVELQKVVDPSIPLAASSLKLAIKRMFKRHA